jgi:hypothetical protein
MHVVQPPHLGYAIATVRATECETVNVMLHAELRQPTRVVIEGMCTIVTRSI